MNVIFYICFSEVILKVNKKLALRVVFLGGVGEIGKNMTALEFGDDIIVIDCGSSFPNVDMPGVDLVIPDAQYLYENKDRVRGILLTHGHEDHIGALPFILKELNVPVYGTKLTLAILDGKLREARVNAELKQVKPTSVITLGKSFKVEFVNVSHSIAGSCALSISTPIGIVFHTGDFKVDYTPICGNVIDLSRISAIGKQDVLLLLAESTNVERPGYTMSEATVKKSLNAIFSENIDHRILVATFATNIHRIQQILDLAIKYKRKVVFSGRSMINIFDCATKVGELSCPSEMLVDIDHVSKYDDRELLIITTGSQGEPMSALTRMASGEFNKIKLGYNDTVIISASPIPGNEKSVYNVINNIYRQGARVIYESLAEVHVSGHACKEELKLIHTLLSPKFFIPVHGEHRHLKKHAELAVSIGMSPANIVITDIGDVAEITSKSISVRDRVPAGQLLVDGLGVGDVGNDVLSDRKHLSEEGLITIALGIDSTAGELKSIDILARGFVYMNQTDALITDCKNIILRRTTDMNLKSNDRQSLKGAIKKDVKNFIFKKTKRNPMIVIMVVECGCAV
jgi:ribonuclease J